MQITINLLPDLEEDLISQVAQSNIPPQNFILQALRRATQPTSAVTSQWPEAILA